MCIRDRLPAARYGPRTAEGIVGRDLGAVIPQAGQQMQVNRCLLYTSDAADERSSVDLGGRRIIKKKMSDDSEYLADRCLSTRR